MAIKIHHGPNGSYKTSGAVWDDAVPAAKAGRLIVTNIRGMSEDRFRRLFPDLPDSFELEYINHETQAGMERIRTWFQWAPRDAFLIFDEAQSLFPKKWTDKYLERFDYPGGLDAANQADRPFNFLDAWTRHRHWNWDVVLTTPNIKYVHEEIRQTSEAAYQHSNLMLLGRALKFLVQKDYKEAMHSAQENKAPADGSTIVQLRSIDKRVFKLYDSTATGQHRDTMAGKNALMSPKVMALLGIVALVFGVLYFRHGASAFGLPLSGEGAAPVAAPPAAVPAQVLPVASVRDDNPERVSGDPVAPVLTDPFRDFKITVKAGVHTETKGTIYLFELASEEKSFEQSSRDMVNAGYAIRSRSLCAVDLLFNGEVRTVACSGQPPAAERAAKRLGSERQGSLGGGPSVTVIPDNSRLPRTLPVESYTRN